MGKLKTRSAAAKRFSVTGSGKFKSYSDAVRKMCPFI